jgi:hypothetical protein
MMAYPVRTPVRYRVTSILLCVRNACHASRFSAAGGGGRWGGMVGSLKVLDHIIVY